MVISEACVNAVAIAANVRLFIYVNRSVCGWDMKININSAVLNAKPTDRAVEISRYHRASFAACRIFKKYLFFTPPA